MESSEPHVHDDEQPNAEAQSPLVNMVTPGVAPQSVFVNRVLTEEGDMVQIVHQGVNGVWVVFYELQAAIDHAAAITKAAVAPSPVSPASANDSMQAVEVELEHLEQQLVSDGDAVLDAATAPEQ